MPGLTTAMLCGETDSQDTIIMQCVPEVGEVAEHMMNGFKKGQVRY